MEKAIIINITNIFIDIILSSVLNSEKVYGCKYNNIELLNHYYVEIPHKKDINIVNHCFIGAEELEYERIFYFCCFDKYNINTNNKENGYIIPLEEWNKICKKYNIIFIPQIEKIEYGFLFISDIFYIKNGEKKVQISAENLINQCNKDFKGYFTNYIKSNI